MKPLSYSEMSLYLTDKAAWFNRYILGQRDTPNFYMTRGTDIHQFCFGGHHAAMDRERYTNEEIDTHERISIEYEACVHPFGNIHHEIGVRIPVKRIPTYGVWDGYEPRSHTILELKTGSTLWSEKRVMENDQIVFYAAQHLQRFDRIPKVVLITASTKDGRVRVIPQLHLDEKRIKEVIDIMRQVWSDKDFCLYKKQRK